MKIILVLLFLISAYTLRATLSIQGVYQGKEIYVQNPEDADGFGFCATKVTVNGDVMTGGVNRSAFNIDFSQFNIAVGDPVFIVIEHNDGCKPKILNPEVLLPKSTFEIVEMSVKEDGTLKWKTKNEQGSLPYVIEQYRWNKWVSAGEVDGEGTSEENEYEYKIIPHSGENKLRIVQQDHSGLKRKSEEITFDSNLPEVEMAPKKVKTEIRFTANGKPVETKYEIWDAYGNIIKRGFGSTVNCENLKKAVYYINFDNTDQKFIKG